MNNRVSKHRVGYEEMRRNDRLGGILHNPVVVAIATPLI